MAYSKNRQLVFIALLAAQAVVLSLIEQAIPTPFTIAPGAKLGLANMITCIALFKLPVKDTISIIMTRLLLASFLGGTLSTLLFSFAGSTVSFIGMYSAYQLGPKRVSLIGISIVGATFHNFGQLIMASYIAGSWYVLLYLPLLTFVGILSGAATGVAANYLLQALNKIRIWN
ncbi:MAG: Gx transporter family protein [Defluviitaleaceae bacterium]|nr:Gx transporter family protein [Defluviitaleaceae bacterium]